MTEQTARTEKAIAAELRLRPASPTVTRLSRKALIVLGATGSAVVASAVAFAMTSGSAQPQEPELYDVEHNAPAETLQALPRDYAARPRDVPDLGPPLPGDLGGPILEAGQGPASPSSAPMTPIYAPAQAAPPSSVAPATPNAAQDLRVQEREAARLSQLFFEGGGRGAPAAETRGAMQGSSTDALNVGADRQVSSAERLQAPVSPYVVQAGGIIPAAIVTGIRGDLPGQVVAQVTQNVFDSPTGRHLLIPQGSRLIGTYDDRIAFGQSRVLLAWTRLILPNGRSLVLERLPAGDSQGYAGLQDGVNRHWGRLAGAALLSTILGAGAELAADDDDGVSRSIRRAFGETTNLAGQQVVGRTLDIEPTLTIRPGYPLRVLITRDLILEPYRS